MDDELLERIARLSPDKRTMLERRLAFMAAPAGDGPVAGNGGTSAPTSFAQQGQWFVHLLDTANPFFNKTDAVRVRGQLDLAGVRQAVTALITRHEVLRTMYVASDLGPRQVVADPEVDVPLVDVDISRSPVELHRLIAEQQRRPFDLEHDLKYRAVIFRLGPDDHVLARTNHHIAFDRWSSGIANRELSTLYQAFVAGVPHGLEPLPYQYVDYAVWQRAQLDEAAIERHLKFYAAHVAGVPQVLELPTDRPRPSGQAHPGSSYSTELDPDLVGAIRRCARSQSATAFMVALSGFASLVGRLARREHFLVGVPAAGRSTAGSDRLIGLFINSMVMRMDLRNDPTFAEMVARVRAATLATMRHQALPFDRLVEHLAHDRRPGRTPMFQVMFDYINTPGGDFGLGSLELEPFPVADEASVYDLNLYVYDDGDRVRTRWEYRTDLFDHATIVRMANAYATLLGAAVADPQRKVRDLPVVDATERARILETGAGPQVATDPQGFLDRIRYTASQQPTAIAVEAGGMALSYGDLWRRATAVASSIGDSSVPSGSPVGLVTGRSADLVVGLLGILLAGRTVALLDPAQPPVRLEAMVGEAGIRGAVAGVDPPPALAGLVMVEAAARPGSCDDLDAPPPDSDAYLVFTSGSTGTPRAVAVGMGALENFVADAVDRYQLKASDKVLQFAAPGFDTTLEELLPALVVGATVVLRPDELFASFSDFSTFVADGGITLLDLPTAWWHAWVDDMERTGDGVPASVRTVIIGGEAATVDRWQSWSRRAGGIRLVNTYGPSETTVVVSTFEPTAGWSPDGSATLPLGRPIRNVRLSVVGPAGGDVPVGMPGELVVAGAAVGSGYPADPELTRRRFEPDAADPGAVRYRTGDLVRMTVDGIFHYLGRIDEQVKVRGTRIEPGEVEIALRSHADVVDAVVVVGTAAEVSLVGHVVLLRPVDDAALVAYLAARVPPAMIPMSWHRHDKLPLTISGKVDRALLRAVDQEEAGSVASPAERPRTATEDRLAALWEQLLERSRVGPHDDFFLLGGHSLMGVRLISHAADEFGVTLPLRTIYEAPTLSTMATRIEGLLDQTSVTPGR